MDLCIVNSGDDFREMLFLEEFLTEEKISYCQDVCDYWDYDCKDNFPLEEEVPKYVDAIIAGLTTVTSDELLKWLLLVLKLLFLIPSQWMYYPDRPEPSLEEQQLESLLDVIQSKTHHLLHYDAIAVVAGIWYNQRKAVQYLVTRDDDYPQYYEFNDEVVVMAGGHSGFLYKDWSDYHDLVLAHVGYDEEDLREWVEENYNLLNKIVGKDLWYRYVDD